MDPARLPHAPHSSPRLILAVLVPVDLALSGCGTTSSYTLRNPATGEAVQCAWTRHPLVSAFWVGGDVGDRLITGCDEKDVRKFHERGFTERVEDAADPAEARP